MRNAQRAVCRVLALLTIVAGLALGLASAASAAPSIPGIPDCKDAPTAQMPGGGITGVLDEGPATPPAPQDPFAPNPRTSVYEQYGYAGLSWHTYDLGCGGGMRDVEASIDTAIGNFLMSTATWGTAATNGLHNKVSHPEQYMAPLDDVVGAVTQRLHDSIWSPWGAAALVGVGALLLLYSLHGRLSSATSAAAWALLVLAVVAGIGQYPTRVATFFDGTVTSSIGAINSSVSGLTDLPASSDPARAQGGLVVDRILYDSWLRGQLGSTDSTAAKRWGPDLFRASAFTWAEADQAQRDPAAGKRIAERKAENWKKVAAQVEQQDPVAYSYLQGKAGGRAGTGVMVALGSMFSLLFRLVADIFLFAGLVMLRLLVMMFPAVAVIGVMAPMASVVRRVFAMGGASVVNVIAFSAGSAVHTTVISAILSRATNTGMGVLGIVLCLVTTVAAFIVLYPLLSFSSILGHSGSGHRVIKRGGREVWNYALRRKATSDGMNDATDDLVNQRQHVPGTDVGSDNRPSGFHQHSSIGYLPSESFARPAPTSAHQPMPEGARLLSAPAYSQLSAAAAPRYGLASIDVPTRAPSPESQPDLEDPAYALAASAEANLRTTLPANHPDIQVLSGSLVDKVPEHVRELPNLAHDSHTQIRRDGVGPRLYDPATKQTVLSLQKRPEE